MIYEERNTTMGILDKLTKEDLFMTESEAKRWEEWERNIIYNDGVKDGMNQEIEQEKNQGVEEEKRDTIKKMQQNQIDVETISKVTGKSLEEINNILS